MSFSFSQKKHSSGARLMTEGNIAKQLILFALPLLVGNLFQQLYNTVDSIVVGNYVSKTALAAVGSTDCIINTIIGFFSGLSTGAGVVISHNFGSRDDKALHCTVHTTIALTLVLAVFFTIAGLFLSPFFLRLMDTPEDVLPESSRYLTIYFAGVSGLMLYNMGAGILRAVGDSTRPLYILIVCAITNIILDLVFVIVFHMGVSGVAYATIISQWISAILVLSILTKETNAYKLVWKDLRIDKATTLSILRIGFPAGLQMAVTSFSNVFVQSYINHFGSSCMAGWTTYGKLDKFCLLPIQSVGLSVTTFVGQNLGAGNMKEARDTDNKMIAFSVFCCTCVAAVMFVMAPLFPKLYNTNAEARTLAKYLIMITAFFMPQNAFLHATYFTLRSGGKTIITFLFDSVFIWVVSVTIAFTLSRFTGLPVLGIYAMVQAADMLKCVIGFILVKKGVWLQNIVS